MGAREDLQDQGKTPETLDGTVGILGPMGERNTTDEAPDEGGASLTFGARLRSKRRAAGLTQEELALRAGLSPNAVGTLERGARKRPQPHTVRSLSDALGLSEEERAALLASVPERGGTTPLAEGHPPASPVVPALPRPTTPLVGREREVEEVGGLLAQRDARPLTLTGMGGVGKTRLAVEAARAAADSFPDGAAFVGLAPLKDPSLVVPEISRSLGLPEAGGCTPAEALVDHLKDKTLLLVLDNLEHLLDAASEVAAFLEGCPGLAVLATSRAPLRVRGETEYPVPPLALPPTTRSPSEREVLASPSGMLFAERARAASPGFAVTEGNAADVAAICWRLAGLPLALELAAAKTKFLDPATLLSRLDRALSVAWARDLPERQRTMRATLDWSFELLSGPERPLLGRLSVFAGGFTIEGAEAVGVGPSAVGSVGGADVLGLLGALVEQSLVTARTGEGETRYGMLEPVRQYAVEKLKESGELEETRRRHAAFFVRLAEENAPGLRGPWQAAWLDLLEREQDNFRTAFSWALGDTGDAPTAARMAWALQSFLWVRGYHREGRRWAEATLRRGLPDGLRARALHVAAMTAYIQGSYAEAGKAWEDALLLSRRAGDTLVEASALSGEGLVRMARAEPEAAIPSLEESVALFGRCDDHYMATVARGWFGLALFASGDTEGAERTFEEALAWVRPTGNPSVMQVSLYNLAELVMARGDHGRAGRMLEEAVGFSERLGDGVSLAHGLQKLAIVASSRGEAERVATLLGAAEGLLQDAGAPGHAFFNPDPSLLGGAAEAARTALGGRAFERARERGGSMTSERAVAYALGSDAAGSDPVTP